MCIKLLKVEISVGIGGRRQLSDIFKAQIISAVT